MKNTCSRKGVLLLATLTSVSLGFAKSDSDRPPRGERPDMFALADVDESGTVTLEELLAAQKEMAANRPGPRGGPELSDEQLAEMESRMAERTQAAFAKADADESGDLTREEFENMRPPRPPRGGPDEDIKQLD